MHVCWGWHSWSRSGGRGTWEWVPGDRPEEAGWVSGSWGNRWETHGLVPGHRQGSAPGSEARWGQGGVSGVGLGDRTRTREEGRAVGMTPQAWSGDPWQEQGGASGPQHHLSTRPPHPAVLWGTQEIWEKPWMAWWVTAVAHAGACGALSLGRGLGPMCVHGRACCVSTQLCGCCQRHLGLRATSVALLCVSARPRVTVPVPRLCPSFRSLGRGLCAGPCSGLQVWGPLPPLLASG